VFDGIVTLVDAANIERQPDRGRPQQIAYAECILLNKVDLVETDPLLATI
jgi:G3E family GTPase